MGMHDKESDNNHNIKMGVELELQGIEYDDLETVTPDHLRLFQGKGWYLEVDGSGNLEFVSDPFPLKEGTDLKKSPLYESVQQMHKLLAHIISKSKEEIFEDENSRKKKVHFIFQEKKNTEFEDIGTWVLEPGKNNASLKETEAVKKKTDIKIIIKDLTCRVRPQATFEFPLHLVPQFTSYMATKHPKLTNIKNTLVEKEYDGFTYLMSLYIRFLEDEAEYGEAGPKEKFSLMSRKSFSSMYASLDKKSDLLSIFEKELDNQLFAIPYFIIFDGKDISKNNEFYNKELKTITVRDWINSIANPKFRQEKREIYKAFWKELLEKKDHDDEYELLTYQIDTLGLYGRDTDIISPPPFLDNNYAMGKYDYQKSPTAIIEMRGYTKAYDTDMRMGSLVLYWLERELYNASHAWDTKKIVSIEKYKDLYQKIEEDIENSDWNAAEDNIRSIMAIFKKSEKTLLDLKKEQDNLNISNALYKNQIFDMTISNAYIEDKKALDENILELIYKAENDKRRWVMDLLNRTIKGEW